MSVRLPPSSLQRPSVSSSGAAPAGSRTSKPLTTPQRQDRFEPSQGKPRLVLSGSGLMMPMQQQQGASSFKDPQAGELQGLTQTADPSKDEATQAKVKHLQEDLIQMGFLDRKFLDASDGYGHFGAATLAALKAFERVNGIQNLYSKVSSEDVALLEKGAQARDPGMVYQYDGDNDGDKKNSNCGFASSLMVLKHLGLSGPEIDKKDAQGASLEYAQAMYLRDKVGAGTSDANNNVSPKQVADAITAGGGNAFVPSIKEDLTADPKNKDLTPEELEAKVEQGAVDTMVNAFQDPKNQPNKVAFVVAGQVTEKGKTIKHYVAVTGYDPARGFEVRDPLTDKPQWMSADDLKKYMAGRGTQEPIVQAQLP